MTRRCAFCALALVACTAITHATAYKTAPDLRACAACPSHPELAHVPCPPASSPAAPGESLLFALRSVDLGADTSDPSYAVGLDQDCSDGPPGECVGTGVLGLGDHVRSVHLPRGIDNSLGANTFGILRETPEVPPAVRDLAGSLDAQLAGGRWGMILTVEQWNGLPDDDDVRLRVQAARGIQQASRECGSPGAATPRWDGTDVWEVYRESGFFGGTAYVTSGQLVWDARDVPVDVHLENGAGILNMRLLNTMLVGAIATNAVEHLVLSGRWSGASAHLPIGFLAGEDPAAYCALHHALPFIIVSPPFALPGPLYSDVLAIRDPNAHPQCNAISVGLRLEFARAAAAATIPCAPPGPVDFEPRCLDDGGVAP
jgi:hypothetical protein